MMFWFALWSGLTFTAGAVLGATLLRDFLDRPRRVKHATLPLAIVLHRAEAKRLELPAIKRRQEIRAALGWERMP